MSTVQQRRQQVVESPTQQDSSDSKLAFRRRRRKWRTWLVMFSPVMLLLWLAPTLIAHSPLRNRALQSAAAELHGTITAGSASLGWWSPIVLHDVEVRDEEGNPVVKIASVAGERSLWQLLLDARELGPVHVHQPQITVALNGDGSNLEHLLSSYLDPNRPASSHWPAVSVEVVDGTVTVRDTIQSRHWQIEDFELTLNMSRDWVRPLEARFAGSIPQPDRTARFSAELQLPGIANASKAESHQARFKLETQQLPLAMLEPMLWRRVKDLRMDGWLTTKADLTWERAGSGVHSASIAGDIAAEQFILAAPSVNPDQLRFTNLQIPCQLEYQPGRLVCRQMAIRCDAGELEVQGDVPLRLDLDPAAALWEALAREAYEINGRLELSRLAALFPQSLRIREGIEIREGEVQLSLSRAKLPGESSWRGHLKTNRLAAVHRGKQLVWDKPVDLQFAAHEGAKGPEIDRLVCTSSFFELEGAGSLEALSINATYDLKKLAAELGQFVDLGGIELSGDGWSYLSCHRFPDGKVEVDGEFQIRQFGLTVPGRQPWHEENLIANLSVVGLAEKTQLQRIDAATFKLENHGDQLQVELLQPIANLESAAAWPVSVHAQGELATWRPRLAILLGERPEWHISGNGVMDATANAATKRVEVLKATCQVDQLKVLGPGLNLYEPRVTGELTGLRFPVPGRLEVDALRANGTAASVNLAHLKWLAAYMPDGPLLTAHCELTGELARLQPWFGEPNQPAANQWAGQLRGIVDLTAKEAGQGLEANFVVANLAARQNDLEIWNEPQVKLALAGLYNHQGQALHIDRFEFVSSKLACQASGKLEGLNSQRQIQLHGKLEYDPQHVLQLVRPYVGEGIELVSAKESREFSLQGPLSAEAAISTLKVESSLGWTGANVYGFRIGSGELKAKLADGLLDIAPLDLAVSEGRLTATPRFRLSPEPREMILGKGPLLTQVRITPEMCDRGLKYVAPVLAGVTQAEGKFSISMDGCRLPLADVKKGELAGQFTVHSVEIGPGPLVRELAVLLNKASTARLSRESVVPFRMVDGRIYHRDLELVFPDLTIRTHGSVGLDQSLAIIAEMPVPPKWIGNNPLGSAIKNQTIRLPIAGTLDHPKIDQQALQQATAAFIRNSATNVLLDEVNKRLDKLFTPREE